MTTLAVFSANTATAPAGDSHLVEWNTLVSIETPTPPDVPRLPSFFSSLVSRRYAYCVKFGFGACLGPRYMKTMRFRIPVQMVHLSVGEDFGDPKPEKFEDNDKVPPYIP